MNHIHTEWGRGGVFREEVEVMLILNPYAIVNLYRDALVYVLRL